ncbi:DUF5958 family protein [Streptomyces netropsis]
MESVRRAGLRPTPTPCGIDHARPGHQQLGENAVLAFLDDRCEAIRLLVGVLVIAGRWRYERCRSGGSGHRWHRGTRSVAPIPNADYQAARAVGVRNRCDRRNLVNTP